MGRLSAWISPYQGPYHMLTRGDQTNQGYRAVIVESEIGYVGYSIIV